MMRIGDTIESGGEKWRVDRFDDDYIWIRRPGEFKTIPKRYIMENMQEDITSRQMLIPSLLAFERGALDTGFWGSLPDDIPDPFEEDGDHGE